MTGLTAPAGRGTDAHAPSDTSVVDRLLAIEPLDRDSFATTIPPRRNLPRLFGGQVAAQALLAAARTIPDGRPPHSLHAYFIRMGRPDVPLCYRVDRTRDGRSFATRHVTAVQEGEVILELLASFQQPEPGANWQMDALPAGEAPPRSDSEPHPRLAHLGSHLDIRLVGTRASDGWRVHPFWFRTDPPIGDNPGRNAAMLTYVSDIAFMANAREPGPSRPMRTAASLDHAIWFHRVPRVDDWLLFRTESVANIGTRGMVRGTMHTADGQLVASITQEALLRPAAPS